MQENQSINYISDVLKNLPSDWLNLTTHRLDIYNESLAKTEFIDQFENLVKENDISKDSLSTLPTAYDYIRLGHPLSCVLEWMIAQQHQTNTDHVISFSSQTAPLLAVLRKNLLENKKTRLLYTKELPPFLDTEKLDTVYNYQLTLQQVKEGATIPPFEGSTVFLMEKENLCDFEIYSNINFYINTHAQLGSIVLIDQNSKDYISEIQHVRRRETIAMTPADCIHALQKATQNTKIKSNQSFEKNKNTVQQAITTVTGTTTTPLVASSGLSMQYAIMMGLVDHALEHHAGKEIRFIVPPNCYGGTNDQARRVAACIDKVAILDLPVDGDNDMVQSLDNVLDAVAKEDAIPFIIVEIPTNPRVEVPDLKNLKKVLDQERKTEAGTKATEAVFIIDQTFCPNYLFLGEGEILSSMPALSYASGSKFPSGGKCTAGYCVANNKAADLMSKIDAHLELCDNEATSLQYEILAEQLPSMNQRIADAYKNTRAFVTHIQKKLPEAKINFVSEELATQGFTPSVFSLDLPTKGNTPEEKESYKRELNHKLINMMITEIPTESKYCVSYGQLKGCYWTIPATSTQGTTKEGDKDYIARVAVSPDLDLEKHKNLFTEFASQIN